MSAWDRATDAADLPWWVKCLVVAGCAFWCTAAFAAAAYLAR